MRKKITRRIKSQERADRLSMIHSGSGMRHICLIIMRGRGLMQVVNLIVQPSHLCCDVLCKSPTIELPFKIKRDGVVWWDHGSSNFTFEHLLYSLCSHDCQRQVSISHYQPSDRQRQTDQKCDKSLSRLPYMCSANTCTIHTIKLWVDKWSCTSTQQGQVCASAHSEDG